MNEARVYRSAALLLVLASTVGYCVAAYWRIQIPLGLIVVAALGVLAVFVAGDMARRRSLGIASNQDVYPSGTSPPWIWILGISLAIVALPGLLLNSEGRLVDFSARPAQTVSVHERNGKYFAQNESATERPITAEEFERTKRTVVKFLALGILFFAFVGLVMWEQELQHRERRGHER